MGFAAETQEICEGFGPQSPRDISTKAGQNTKAFALAPSAASLNLCNIHTHTQAEHRGPGFAYASGAGGFRCNGSDALTAAERAPLKGAYKGAAPGDTVEVHWVYSSCDVMPGEGLAACAPQTCAEPQIRVEAQVFLLVNDPEALDFGDYAYAANRVGRPQPKALPDGGVPVIYAGSTTGPAYSASICSPLHVTWSVRPDCVKLDIASLHRWAEANVFNETKSHGVRALVTAPALLSPIE